MRCLDVSVLSIPIWNCGKKKKIKKIEVGWSWAGLKVNSQEIKWGFDFDLPKSFHISANPEVFLKYYFKTN